MLKNINPISLSVGRSVLGFNFSANTVKIVCSKVSSSKPEITGVKICNIEGLSDDQAAKAIRDAVRELKAVKSLCSICIDSQLVITKNIEIPSIKDDEIRGIIDLQAGRYTPYSREEIIVDHINIDTYHNSYTKVLIVIVVSEIINKQLLLLTRAGLNVSKIQFAAESVGAACSKLFKLSAKPVPSIILSINNQNSDFIVIFKAKTIFCRSIPIGADNFTSDPKGAVGRFAEELKKSLDAYRSEDIEAIPNEILLIGSSNIVDTIKLEVAQGLNIPARNILFYSGFSLPGEFLKADPDISLVNAISSVVTLNETMVDLRPADLKLKMAFHERSKEIIKSGIFAMLIIVIICILLLIKIYFRGVYLSKLDEQSKKISPEVTSLEKIITKNMVIKSFLVNKNRALEIISRLYEFIPETIYLKSVTVGEDSTITMKGTASAMSEVFSFVTSLENSGYFKNVKAQNTSSRKDAGKDVSDFEITCVVQLKPTPEKIKVESIKVETTHKE